MEILSGSLCHIQVPKPNIQIQNQACLCHFCKNANGGMTDVDSSSVFMSRVSRFRFDSVIFKMTSNELASILFVVAGGTIDKDYPRSTGGYAFEFGDEPAIERLLLLICLSYNKLKQGKVLQRICHLSLSSILRILILMIVSSVAIFSI